jgi:hypothetical protein
MGQADNGSAEDRELQSLEESKRFFSRFAPPVAHHNMVQYSHLGKPIFRGFLPVFGCHVGPPFALLLLLLLLFLGH